MSDDENRKRSRSFAIFARFAAAALIALHAGLAWTAREPGVLTGQDDAEYIVLARSLLRGGYNDLFRVDSPAHRTYPPVYPAALAAWSLVAGFDWDSLVALNITFSAAMLAVLFVALRRVIGGGLALTTVALLSINPVLIEFAGGVRAEPLFMLLAMIALGSLIPADAARTRAARRLAEFRETGVRPNLPPPSDTAWIITAIVTAALAALTRSVGVTLIAALALHWLLQKRWLLVGVPAAFAIGAIGVWLAWTARNPEMFVGSSYIAELRAVWSGTPWTGALPGRALRYARSYAVGGLPWSMAVPTVAGTPIDNAAAAVFFGTLGVAGMVALFRRWRAATLWLLTYGFLLLIWLFQVDRFAVPAVPILIAATLTGARFLGQRFGRRIPLALPAFAAALLALGATIGTRALILERAGCDRSGKYPDPTCMSEDQRSYFDALRWIDANTPANAVFLSAKPGALYLYTGRRSINYDRVLRDSDDRVLQDIRDQGADWILLDSLHNLEPRLLAPLLAQNCTSLRVERTFPPRTWLFRLAGPGGDVASTAACDAVATYIAANRLNDFGQHPHRVPGD